MMAQAARHTTFLLTPQVSLPTLAPKGYTVAVETICVHRRNAQEGRRCGTRGLCHRLSREPGLALQGTPASS